DMPTSLPEGMVIGAVLKREDPRDAVLLHPRYHGSTDLADLPQGAVLGSSSVRRVAQLRRHFPHLQFESVRGNLNTRLNKLISSHHYAGLVLAAAGVHRMGWTDKISKIHYTGTMDVRCQFCGASRFQREQLNCCHNGKVLLPPLQGYPENLRLLFDADGAEGSNLRQNIRNYNSAFAFASFGANIRPPPGRGPYCFRLQNHTYHYASNLHADDPEERRYGQPYILETNETIQTIANVHENANCLVSVFLEHRTN
ncbi:Porphobilinogen deaminase N-terminal, partial [Trinorchestia longiramus]